MACPRIGLVEGILAALARLCPTQKLSGKSSDAFCKGGPERGDAYDVLGDAGEVRTASRTGDRPFPWAPPEDYDAWSRAILARGLHLGLGGEIDALYAEI